MLFSVKSPLGLLTEKALAKNAFLENVFDKTFF